MRSQMVPWACRMISQDLATLDYTVNDKPRILAASAERKNGNTSQRSNEPSAAAP